MGIHTGIVTFVSALFFGIVFIIISNRIKVSAIVILLLGGIFLGPSILGVGLLDPKSLGEGLTIIIKLSVALILFEGGLTLDVKGYREVSREIRRALTWGVIITWLLSSITIKFLFGFMWHFNFTWPFALLAGSLVIVTGPTVIGPLLKRIGVQKKIHSFLHWEGVLIDPIGVFISLLMYEWIIGHNALTTFLLRISTGISIGIFSGLLLIYIIRKQWLSDEHLNVFILSYALALFTISDVLVVESGLMSVTIAGFVVGYIKTPLLDNIKVYKAQLIELLIGLLFMLLAANLDIESFGKYKITHLLIAIGIIMFLVRPINILVSTYGKRFSFKEKLFLSWIAPRGIVAASMASLFALNIKEFGGDEYKDIYSFLEAFTYSVIVGTVIFQGFTAKPVGRLLKVLEPEHRGWLIIGAHPVALAAAEFIRKRGFPVTVIDTNLHSVKVARQEGFTALSANALTIDPDDYPELYGVGNILAITKNENLNLLACQQWKKKLKGARLYRWSNIDKMDEETDAKSSVKIATPVWPSLELNTITTQKINSEDFTIFTREIGKDAIKHPERVLMFFSTDRMLPYLPEDAQGTCTCMVYHPFDIKPNFNMEPQWVLYSQQTTYIDVIRELLARVNSVFPSINAGELEEYIIQQEREFSSVIGFDTALPHTYVDGIDKSIVAIAKMETPVACMYNDEAIHFVFLVLSPRDKPDTHIKTLSNISKFLLNEDHRVALTNAESYEDLCVIFFPDRY
ncbi:MAG: PTS transporter subunit EIIA [bacterium]|nr:PTS transporter subunit EIIA [bacterium]